MTLDKLKKSFKRNAPVIISLFSGALVGGLIMYNRTAVYRPENAINGDTLNVLVNKAGRIVKVTKA